MTSKDAAANSALGVLALNVLGQGGIGDSWQTGGLNSSTRLECTADAPLACSGDGCATVWLQSDECAVLNATHVRLTGKTLSPAVAQLQISVAPQSLHERVYRFALRVPVWNGSGWEFPSIDAQLEVRAVADAHQSEVRVRNESDRNRPAGGVVVSNHLEALVVEIVARDINGVHINRTGERIAVRFVGSDGGGANRTELAQFDAVSARYFLLVTIAWPGEHDVLLDTDASAPGPSKARVRVVCAYGYTEVYRVCSKKDARSVQRNVIAGSIVGVLVLGFLGLMVYMVRRHREHWRAFLLSFLKHEGVIALEVLWEVWDISGDLFMFVAIKDIGNLDLFAAFGVFIVPATVFSAATIGMKLWLLKRRTAQRMDARHTLRSAPMDFRLLCDLFMLRTSQRRHEELKSANDGSRYQAYSYILLALTEVWRRAARLRSDGLSLLA
jgi:hypothetical protein